MTMQPALHKTPPPVESHWGGSPPNLSWRMRVSHVTYAKRKQLLDATEASINAFISRPGRYSHDRPGTLPSPRIGCRTSLIPRQYMFRLRHCAWWLPLLPSAGCSLSLPPSPRTDLRVGPFANAVLLHDALPHHIALLPAGLASARTALPGAGPVLALLLASLRALPHCKGRHRRHRACSRAVAPPPTCQCACGRAPARYLVEPTQCFYGVLGYLTPSTLGPVKATFTLEVLAM